MRTNIICILLLNLVFLNVSAQSDSIKPNFKTRKTIVVATTGVLAGGSLLGLNQAWYKAYNTGKFHLFNDNDEWLQMDKAGHVYTTYQTSVLMMEAFDWAGYNKTQKLFIGGSIGFVYLTAIECMDGFSKGWGFSWGDQLSDALGSSMAIAQEAFWKEQRFQLKFWYAPSGLAKYNPNLLGKKPSTQILKDYNAQTYWLSINPSTFLEKENRFPKWLSAAFGYGAYGMLGGRTNNVVVRDNAGNIVQYVRERRFYFSPDIDLSKLKTKNKFLKKVLLFVNILKIPMPAIEYSNTGFKFHPLFF